MLVGTEEAWTSHGSRSTTTDAIRGRTLVGLLLKKLLMLTANSRCLAIELCSIFEANQIDISNPAQVQEDFPLGPFAFGDIPSRVSTFSDYIFQLKHTIGRTSWPSQ